MISGTSAGFGRRLAALLYDSVLLAGLLIVYTTVALVFTRGVALTESTGLGWYVYRIGEVAVVGAYYVLNLTRSGQTLGMRAWHLRAVSDTGKPLKFATAVLRSLYGLLAWAPAALGVLWLYFDPDRLALHDRLSKTRTLHLTGP